MPELPFALSRRNLLVAAACLLALLYLGGKLLSSPPEQAGLAAPAAPPSETAPAAPTRLVVDVVGAVRRPGLYRLAEGARVADAVARAGGATRKADLALINLAAPLADGVQVVVPRRGAVGAAAPSGAAGSSASTGPVHLNTATLEQLDALPGVGPVTAQKILDYRQEHGAFSSVDELDAVPGIGPARLDELSELVAP
ncbi:MAG TPA: helix-hairpin-helix domain-containing protein [Gaiellaceae bacterium]|nr:helix-hairpin-helix domain-containing protein [Gaiellaceae bacterium]